MTDDRISRKHLIAVAWWDDCRMEGRRLYHSGHILAVIVTVGGAGLHWRGGRPSGMPDGRGLRK